MHEVIGYNRVLTNPTSLSLLNGYFLSYKTTAVVEKSMHHTDNGFENALCNEFHWIMSSVSHNYHYTYRTPYRN